MYDNPDCKDKEAYSVGVNQFFITYSDGSRKVRDIKMDPDDYKSDTYENIKKHIADNIARLRKEKRLSCEALADEVGISRQYIAQIEHGERNVSLEILSKIAQALSVDIPFLIRQNPFSPGNIYMDLLCSELRALDSRRQKELCAEVIEKLWKENDG